jgi:hypothetical protein
MNKEFIPYEQALELKQLGFDEHCLASYETAFGKGIDFELGYIIDGPRNYVLTPLYQQAFRWLRYKHNCVCEIIRKEDGNHSEFIGWVYIDGRKIDVVSYWDSKSYEEAELECLNKLIQLAKTLNNER